MKFSFRRFIYLLRLQLAVNRKLYLLGIASIAGILLAFMLFLSYMEGLNYNSQTFMFIIGLILSSAVFGSTIFKQFSKKEDRTMALMLPASAGERIAVALLLVIVIYPLVYMIISVPCLMIAGYLDFHWNNHVNPVFLPGNIETLYAFIANTLVQSFVLLGAIWFRKQAFVKTVVLLFVTIFMFILLSNYSGEAAIQRHRTADAFARDTLYSYSATNPYYYIRLGKAVKVGESQFEHVGTDYLVALPSSVQIPFLLGLGLVPLFLWGITWMKIREQQL